MANSIKLNEHFTFKKLLRFVLPSILMMIFSSIYGVIDGFFVSNFANESGSAFAGVNFTWPILMIFQCFGLMMGAGGSALVGKILGEKDTEKANKYFTMIFLVTLGGGILFSIIGFLTIEPIINLLGATGELKNSAVLYGKLMVSFNLFAVLQMFFQSIFVLAEKPKLGTLFTVLAGVTNILLDTLFVALFKWGLNGAAVASILGQFVGGIIPIFYFLNKKNKSLLRFQITSIKFKPIIKVFSNGLSELLSNISGSISGMLFNFQILKYIGEKGVSAFGTVMYTQMIFMGVFIGFLIGISPIISYNYGAKNEIELKNIFKKSMVIIFAAGALMVILSCALSTPLSYAFVGYDKETFELTKHVFFIYSLTYLLLGYNMFASSLFTALNDGVSSAIISTSRILVFEIVMVLVMPLIFGSEGIWWSVSVAQIFSAIVSTLFIVFKRKKFKYI